MSIASIVRSCLENYSPNWFRSFAKKVIKFLLILKGLKKYRGNKVYIKDRQTIVVVSHEASATGAPILALNICKELSKMSNIVLILLKEGELVESFELYTVGILCVIKSHIW